MKQINKTLSDSKTLPLLQKAILSILQQWRNGRTINFRSFTKKFGVQEAVKDQNNIGWNNFILGIWSQK